MPFIRRFKWTRLTIWLFRNINIFRISFCVNPKIVFYQSISFLCRQIHLSITGLMKILSFHWLIMTLVSQRDSRLMCEVRNITSKIWSKVRSQKSEVRSLKYEVDSPKFEVWSQKFEDTSRFPCYVWSIKSEVWSLKYEVWYLRILFNCIDVVITYFDNQNLITPLQTNKHI